MCQWQRHRCKSRVSACKHGSGLARIHSQRINPFASMPAAKPIASAAGLIQAIKGAREPLLVAHTLMDNASMQRLWARSSEALDQDNYTAEKIRERISCDNDLTECFEWPGVDPETEAEWRDIARSRVTSFATLLIEEVRTSVEARVSNATTALKNSVEGRRHSSG